MFCKRKEATLPFQQTLATIGLSASKRVYIEERYLRLLDESKVRCNKISIYFNGNRIIITIGSIIVPALLSIQYIDSFKTHQPGNVIYWITWIVSLFVTISNGILTLFKLDKKYYLLHTSYEQMITEGWQFLALTGHYKTNDPATNSHETQFNSFTQTVERIHMRQMEEEYIKLQDVNSAKTPSTNEIPTLLEPYKTPTQNDMVRRIVRALRQEEKCENLIEETPRSHENPQNKKTTATSYSQIAAQAAAGSIISPDGGAASMPV
jgi:hypothetical protein